MGITAVLADPGGPVGQRTVMEGTRWRESRNHTAPIC